MYAWVNFTYQCAKPFLFMKPLGFGCFVLAFVCCLLLMGCGCGDGAVAVSACDCMCMCVFIVFCFFVWFWGDFVLVFLSFQKAPWYWYRFIASFSVLVTFGKVAHYTQHLNVMHMVGLLHFVWFLFCGCSHEIINANSAIVTMLRI